MKGNFFTLLYSMFILLGLAVVSYQLYDFLKHGDWNAVSIIDFLIMIKVNWASDPQDWVGVWVILNKIPLALALMMIGGGMIAMNDSCGR